MRRQMQKTKLAKGKKFVGNLINALRPFLPI